MYDIYRFFLKEGKTPELVEIGLTLEQAREHCEDPQTSSKTATTPTAKARTRKHGPWFDAMKERK